MKILIAIYKFFPYGGLQLDFIRIASELIARGHQVICCTAQWDGDIPKNLQLRLLKLSGWSNHSRAADFERRMKKILDEEKPDRFVAFNRMAGADLYFAGDDCLLSTWSRKHCPFILKYIPRYRTFLRQERAVFGPDAKTRIMYIVERQKQEYQEAYGTPDSRFFYLPPGLNLECKRPDDVAAVRAEVRAQLGVAADEILLLLVASQFQVKGADRVIRALAHLPEHLRGKCCLMLCGDTKTARFRTLAEQCGVASRMIFSGPSRDVPRYLLAADLMVHPARLEAAGAVLVESLAAGLPVICSGRCGFSPFVAEAGGVVLPEPFQQPDLLDALENILANPEKLAAMKAQVIDYSGTADFYRRAQVAADIITGKIDGKNG